MNVRPRGALALALVPGLAGLRRRPGFRYPATAGRREISRVAQWRYRHKQGGLQRWWASFRDPTLNRLVDIAYTQNLTLMEAGTRVIEARAVLGQAIGEVYPQQQQLTGPPTICSRAGPTRPPIRTPSPRKILAGQDGRAGRLGARSLGQVPPRRRTGRRRLSRLDRHLRRRARHPDRRRGERLRPDPHAPGADRHRPRERGQAAVGARDRPRPLQGRRDLGARRLPGSERARPDGVGDPAAHGAVAAGRERARRPARPAAGFDRRASRPFARHPRAAARVAVGVPADLLRRRPDVRAAELKAEAQSAKVGIAAADLYPAFSLGGALGTLVSTTNGNKIDELFTSPSVTSPSARRSAGRCSTTGRSPIRCAPRTRNCRRC